VQFGRFEIPAIKYYLVGPHHAPTLKFKVAGTGFIGGEVRNQHLFIKPVGCHGDKFGIPVSVAELNHMWERARTQSLFSKHTKDPAFERGS
jgi:hypothetical protein